MLCDSCQMGDHTHCLLPDGRHCDCRCRGNTMVSPATRRLAEMVERSGERVETFDEQQARIIAETGA